MKRMSENNKRHNRISHITTYQAGIVQAAVHRMLQKKSDDILKPFGISKSQWLIIGTISDAGPGGLRPSELAPILGTTMPYLTGAINLLEEKNMIKKIDDGSDGRAKPVVLHPGFTTQIEAIERALRDGLRRDIYAHVSPEDFDVYLDVLYQMQSIGKEQS